MNFIVGGGHACVKYGISIQRLAESLLAAEHSRSIGNSSRNVLAIYELFPLRDFNKMSHKTIYIK